MSGIRPLPLRPSCRLTALTVRAGAASAPDTSAIAAPRRWSSFHGLDRRSVVPDCSITVGSSPIAEVPHEAPARGPRPARPWSHRLRWSAEPKAATPASQRRRPLDWGQQRRPHDDDREGHNHDRTTDDHDCTTDDDHDGSPDDDHCSTHHDHHSPGRGCRRGRRGRRPSRGRRAGRTPATRTSGGARRSSSRRRGRPGRTAARNERGGCDSEYRRAVPGAEHEAVGVVQPEQALLLAVTTQRGDQQRVQPDAPRRPTVSSAPPDRRSACRPPGPARRPRCIGASPSMSTKHHRRPASSPGRRPHISAGQPHRRTGSRPGSPRRSSTLRLVDGERLARFAGRCRRQQHLGRRVRPAPCRWRSAVLAGLVQVAPGPVDRARGVALLGHRCEQLLEPRGRRPVDPQPTDDRAHVRTPADSGRCRSCSATSAGAWRDRDRRRRPGSRRPATRRSPRRTVSRRRPAVAGASPTGPHGQQLGQIRLGVGPPTRSTLRRDPSGKRTHAIQRCALSLHRTVGREPSAPPARADVARP